MSSQLAGDKQLATALQLPAVRDAFSPAELERLDAHASAQSQDTPITGTAQAPPAPPADNTTVPPPPAPVQRPPATPLSNAGDVPPGFDIAGEDGELVRFAERWLDMEEFYELQEVDQEEYELRCLAAQQQHAANKQQTQALSTWTNRPSDSTQLLRTLSTGVDSGADAGSASSVQSAAEAAWKAKWFTAEGPEGEMSETGAPAKYAAMALRCVYDMSKTGFAEDKDYACPEGGVIAGRYRVSQQVGSAAFSSALSCEDLVTGEHVCLKVVKNNKEYVDQSLDEVKLLRYLNLAGDADQHRVLRLKEYFYYKEHLFIVTELLKENLYDFQEVLHSAEREPYYTLPRVQRIAKQVLQALAFVHSCGIVHCDLKPENVLISSYSRCEVKLIDLGSSCFITDNLTSYIQSRSYRAPEVILGTDYDFKIDVFSVGAMLPELLTGEVLFVNDQMPYMLARLQSMFGPFPEHMRMLGRESAKYFTPDGSLYMLSEEGDAVAVLQAAPLDLDELLTPEGAQDELFVDFLTQLLQVDPAKRPTAHEALQHPWLAQELPMEPYDMEGL